MSTASGQRPPPKSVPKPPAEAASGIRIMKNLLRLLLFFAVMPMAANMGRMANSIMMVTVASWKMVASIVQVKAMKKLSFFTLVPANFKIQNNRRLARPTSLSTTPNIMIIITNITARLA